MAQLRCQEAQGEDTEKWGHQAAAQKGTWSPGGGRKFLLLSWSTHRIPPRERKAKKEVGSHQRELPCRLEKQQPPRTSTPPNQPALSVARLSSRQRRGGDLGQRKEKSHHWLGLAGAVLGNLVSFVWIAQWA